MTGIQSGILAFVLWGLVPLFWKQLSTHNSWELVAHRAAWSFPLLLGVVLSQRRGREFLAALRKPKLWGTTLLLSANWLLYIWLTTNGRFVEASLGYFIVPLLNTLLGVTFLGEKLRPLQKISIVLAGIALLFPLLGDLRVFPWAALLIAFLGLLLAGAFALTIAAPVGYFALTTARGTDETVAVGMSMTEAAWRLQPDPPTRRGDRHLSREFPADTARSGVLTWVGDGRRLTVRFDQGVVSAVAATPAPAGGRPTWDVRYDDP